MYQASDAFHQAVADGKPQKAMLIFDDAVFTNDDINVDVGIRFTDNFNMEEDIAIGQTPSNEISFSLFNDDRLLNSYAFGDFLATIGALIRTRTYQQSGTVYVKTNNATWVGNDTTPYITRNGTQVSQPSFPVKAILGYNDKVWAFSASGTCVVYNDKTGENITSQEKKPNGFMKNKAKTWNGKGLFYNKTNRLLDIYQAGVWDRYEFVPLGYFLAERPKAPDTIQIDMECMDWMQRFERDMPTSAELGVTYPVTLKNLLQKMCEYVGVTLKTTTFINSTAKLTAELKDFETATMRDVLKWIAEAAAGNARFDRDGKLVIDWIRDTDMVLTPNDYETFDPYWYQTKEITKLCNRSSDGSYSMEHGTGDEGYLIQDNPILKGVS